MLKSWCWRWESGSEGQPTWSKKEKGLHCCTEWEKCCEQWQKHLELRGNHPIGCMFDQGWEKLEINKTTELLYYKLCSHSCVSDLWPWVLDYGDSSRQKVIPNIRTLIRLNKLRSIHQDRLCCYHHILHQQWPGYHRHTNCCTDQLCYCCSSLLPNRSQCSLWSSRWNSWCNQWQCRWNSQRQLKAHSLYHTRDRQSSSSNQHSCWCCTEHKHLHWGSSQQWYCSQYKCKEMS